MALRVPPLPSLTWPLTPPRCTCSGPKCRLARIRPGSRLARAADVVLALHELAANAVRHGAGAGRLRIWPRAAAWLCQVEDGDPRPPATPVTATLPGWR